MQCELVDKSTLILLDYISESISPVFFFSREDAAELFNKPDHGLSLYGLAERIADIWKAGLIFIQLNDIIVQPKKIEKILWWLTNENTLRGNYSVTPFVGLTDEGGAVWENAYKPCWEKFTQFFGREIIEATDRFNSKNQIVAIDINLLIEIITAIEGKIKDLNIELKGLSKSNIIELKPFYPVYWKQLNVGYQLDFFINQKDEDLYDTLVWSQCVYRLIPEWKQPVSRLSK